MAKNRHSHFVDDELEVKPLILFLAYVKGGGFDGHDYEEDLTLENIHRLNKKLPCV